MRHKAFVAKRRLRMPELRKRVGSCWGGCVKPVKRSYVRHIRRDETHAMCGRVYTSPLLEDIAGSHLCRSCARVEGII